MAANMNTLPTNGKRRGRPAHTDFAERELIRDDYRIRLHATGYGRAWQRLLERSHTRAGKRANEWRDVDALAANRHHA
jgi:hypothetical protein